MADEPPIYASPQDAPPFLKSRSKLRARGLVPVDPNQPAALICWSDGSKPPYAVFDERTARPIQDAPNSDQRRADRQAAADWAREVLADPNALFLDTETTGLDGMVIEIAAVAADGTVVLQQLIDPGVPIEPGATEQHGLTDADVAGKPMLGEVDLSALDGRRIIAWNGEFDRKALRRSYDHHNLPHPSWLTVEWDDAMLHHAAHVGQWDEGRGHYRVHRCEGDHRCASDCVAGWRKIRAMAGQVADPNTIALVYARLREQIESGFFVGVDGPVAVEMVLRELWDLKARVETS
ncbi:3'-5' exonuclease [Saccharopolyspora pogona]|uniref:3'-5' exonuclease n=1 Tax=Saccharopolyspora pogona TaxID=333966 RepID=UPI001686A45B|nr:3'-5' exonuclease [Saccharopolyspora pogona]